MTFKAMTFKAMTLGLAALVLASSALPALAQAETTRIRGTLEEVDADKITVAKRDGGVEPVGLSSDTRFLEVRPVGIEAIQEGSYIGVAGLPQADGKIRALGVMLFPETARGTNEGHFPWDLQPESTMPAPLPWMEASSGTRPAGVACQRSVHSVFWTLWDQRSSAWVTPRSTIRLPSARQIVSGSATSAIR